MIQQGVYGFKLETTGEKLTAHGGLALMAEYNHGIGLKELVDGALPEPGSNRGYKPSVYVDSLVMMLQAGGERLEDMRELEEEEGLMKLLGKQKIPDADSVGDWLRRMGNPEKGWQGLKGLDQVRSVINERILKRDDRLEYTLDADATEIVAEKDDAEWTYKSHQGYMPMLGFLYEVEICIYDEFREGNASPASKQKEFYQECKKRMPQGKRIGKYRADSASYQAGLINELEKEGVVFSITADHDRSVKEQIQMLEDDGMFQEPKPGCGYEIAETVHSMNQSQQAFRLVIKREKRQKDLFEQAKYFYHVIATNCSEQEKSALEVIQWHNQRGSAENFNKELKNGFGMERMPCGQSYANAVFFRIGVIAYNLFIGFKRLSCPESWATKDD